MKSQPLLSLPDGFLIFQHQKNVLYIGDSDETCHTVAGILHAVNIGLQRITFPETGTIPASQISFILMETGESMNEYAAKYSWIKEQVDLQNVPLVLLYRPDNKAAKEAFYQGGDDYLHLPVIPSEFLVRMKALLTAEAWKDQALLSKKRSLIVSQMLFGLNRGLTFQEVIQTSLQNMVKHAEADEAAVMLLQQDSLQQEWIAATVDRSGLQPINENILMQLLDQKEIVWMNWHQLYTGTVEDSYTALFPIMEQDTLYGVFALHFPAGQKVVEAYLHSTAILCDMLSILTGRHYMQLAADQYARQLQHELKNLGRMQQLLLPEKLLDIPGFNLAAFYLPAHQSGGDYYDVIPLTDDHIAILVADVSGHGAPAAMNMGIARSVLHTISLSQDNSPKNTVYFLNKLLCKLLSKGVYITLFYGVLTIKSKKFRYCNAGHVPAILYKHNKQSIEVLGDPSNGPALGWWTDAEFTEECLQLGGGDQILLYTDGVNEAHNRHYEEFSLERLSSVVKNHPSQSPDQMIQSIMKKVNQHIGEHDLIDDIAIIAMNVNA